ncbi:MAG TPA: chloride channel protein [Candidatus Limnocylindrales bacterium]|nr:chloride channel protein [Candidatus Limnocylindrales bacterium]
MTDSIGAVPPATSPLTEPVLLEAAETRLGDFSMGLDALRLIPLALIVGAIATGIALVLLDLIGLFTNLLYGGRLDVTLVSPVVYSPGPAAVVIPVLGGLVIGLIARFGSHQIRGHGIPEAMETILTGGSKVQPRLAILKPISSAISIGSGGPFGAEGPIILTGGAFGSMVGQFVHLSAAERKTLLVAGAAAGMTAVFGTPVASVLLAVELLLFEWKPRSLIPVAAASLLAGVLRSHLAIAGLVAPAPLFPLAAAAGGTAGAASGTFGQLDDGAVLASIGIGLLGGLVAWLATVAVYASEDAFGRLPIHWMWWPAIGGLVIGIGGLVEPRVLGVGYDSIRAEIAGSLPLQALLVLFVVKLLVWAISLGSGTSGGILAPLLLLGGAAGGLVGGFLPGNLAPDAALLGMAATLAGTTRSPFTSIVFALELTGDLGVLPLLLGACVTADLVSVLALRRSILTEKVARRGFHVSREYAVDPLEALFVRDVMATSVLLLRPTEALASMQAALTSETHGRQRLFPVVDADGRLVGALGRRELTEAARRAMARERSAWRDGTDVANAPARGASAPSRGGTPAFVADVMRAPVIARADETLRHVADRMVEARVGVMPVLDADDSGRLVGLIAQADLLRARDRLLTEERHRERILRARLMPVIRTAFRVRRLPSASRR